MSEAQRSEARAQQRSGLCFGRTGPLTAELSILIRTDSEATVHGRAGSPFAYGFRRCPGGAGSGSNKRQDINPSVKPEILRGAKRQILCQELSGECQRNAGKDTNVWFGCRPESGKLWSDPFPQMATYRYANETASCSIFFDSAVVSFARRRRRAVRR